VLKSLGLENISVKELYGNVIKTSNIEQMKILEISRAYYPSVGGLEKFISDRLKIYEALGIEYQLLSTDYREKKLDYSKNNDKVIFLHRVTPYDITFGLKKYINGDYDIVSVNQVGRYFSDYAISQSYKAGKKIILTPHLHYHTKRFSTLKNLHSIFVLPKILLKVNKIICFTEYEKEYWITNYNFPENKIAIIPHYINLQESKTDYDKHQFGKYFLYLGRNAKNKRVDLLLNAFNSMTNSVYNLVLTIEISELDAKLRKIADENDRIYLVGYVNENSKETLLKNCEALILPSDYEAFGVVLLEASKFKKPILASNLPIIKEVLNTESPIYFENTVTALKERLEHFVSLSDNQKAKLGNENFHNLEKFQLNKIKKMYYELCYNVSDEN